MTMHFKKIFILKKKKKINPQIYHTTETKEDQYSCSMKYLGIICYSFSLKGIILGNLKVDVLKTKSILSKICYCGV